MGNVSSSDHDKVNERLVKRTQKRGGSLSRKLKHQQQHRQQKLFNGQEYQPQCELQLQYECQQSHQRPSLSSMPSSSVGHILDSSEQPSELEDVIAHGLPHGLSRSHHWISSPSSPSVPPIKGLRRLRDKHLVPKCLSVSQTDFYARPKAECSPLTPTSPATSFSATSTIATSISTQPDDLNAIPNFNPQQIQESSVHTYHSAPIVIPQLPPNQNAAQSEHTEGLGTNPQTSSFPLKRNGLDHAANCSQQCLLGSSSDAKEWLKQKPTRSAARMIHQYNFHSHSYYRTPGSLRATNNVTRSLSIHAPPPPLSNSDICLIKATGVEDPENKSVESTISSWPSFLTATAVTKASGNTSTEQYPMDSKPMSGSAEFGKSHSGGAYLYGCSNPSSESLNSSPSDSWERKPRVGRLVMSRSKLYSSSVPATDKFHNSS
ncbi:hypothetical protein BX616_008293 [Lobosporangium transversale]|uniref:Uncharacterized protein n=1 Tax=Lobosporangium transversale TaxID=64571 RepID=A0A1Y2GB88_9FUNG|nr:hypothetical protein BCR41DRAFT_361271 [Lobosporangium transversale]KAF9914441.1 hypothetical protein BX616_008293 [Lobosporangium transversale]ORZ06128.1 hypothetical protein BCR41DRAFT_361271 [Lobosporangium transversale]|eukprot:XP_021877397.1 hypothetical protein BCR41DRAFT_361271 [Lobosporangium transversale]